MMKLTKKEKYGMLLEILAEVELADKDMLVEFVQGEVSAIERKAEKAKERPRAKKEDISKLYKKGSEIGMTSLDYEVGDRVKHTKFGEGTVTEIVNFGRDFMVTVEFDTVGQKKMLAGFAKLEKI